MRIDLRRVVSLEPLRSLIANIHLAATFVLGFSIVAFVIHLALPSPLQVRVAERREKLALIKEWRGTATSAAFGTSRVQNGFVPEIFDAEFADALFGETSLNLALYGGSQTEQRAFARAFLRDLHPPGDRSSVCLVMLELNAGVNFELINLFHPRSIDVYDLDTVRFAASYSGDTVSSVRRIGRIGFALISGGLHYANVGVLSSVIFGAADHGPDFASEAHLERRGFLPVPSADGDKIDPGNPLLPRPSELNRHEVPMAPGNEQLLADLASEPGIPTVQFVYFVMPSLGDLANYPVYPSTMAGPRGPVPIANLARPDRYPQLYAPELWANPGHLSPKGAAIATKLLAQEVKAWLSSQPAVPRCGS